MNKAVLVVSFGTSYKETRDKTIRACEKKIHDCLSDYDFYAQIVLQLLSVLGCLNHAGCNLSRSR